MVDSGSTDNAPALVTTDGVYDLNIGHMTGPEAISDMLRGPAHQDLVSKGIAHVMGLRRIGISGDTAIAVNCTRLCRCDAGGYTPLRGAQNVWKLRGQEDRRWAVKERTNRLEEDHRARDLLRDVL